MALHYLQPIWAFYNPIRNHNPVKIMPYLALKTHFPLTAQFTMPKSRAADWTFLHISPKPELISLHQCMGGTPRMC